MQTGSMFRQHIDVPKTSVALVVTAVALSAFTGAALAGGSASTTTIDSCTTIEDSGHYRLSADIEDSDAETCIAIAASDVTLDGDGRTIDGVGNDSTVGVAVETAESLSAVTVRDLTVSDWGTGVRYRDVDDGEITAVDATNNSDGLALYSAEGNTIADTATTDNDAGIYLDDSSADNEIRANDLTNNTNGIVLRASNENAITDNAVEESADNGIELAAGSENNTVSENDLAATDYGIVVDRSDGNELADNTVESSSRDGIVLTGASNTTVSANHVDSNGRDGIVLYAADGNRIADNEATDNERNGIGLYSSLGLVVQDNTLSDNDEAILDSFSEGDIEGDTTESERRAISPIRAIA